MIRVEIDDQFRRNVPQKRYTCTYGRSRRSQRCSIDQRKVLARRRDALSKPGTSKPVPSAHVVSIGAIHLACLTRSALRSSRWEAARDLINRVEHRRRRRRSTRLHPLLHNACKCSIISALSTYSRPPVSAPALPALP